MTESRTTETVSEFIELDNQVNDLNLSTSTALSESDNANCNGCMFAEIPLTETSVLKEEDLAEAGEIKDTVINCEETNITSERDNILNEGTALENSKESNADYETPLVSVKFKDKDTFNDYSILFSNFFKSLGFLLKDEKQKYILNIFKNESGEAIEQEKRKSKKKKRKRKKSDDNEGLFVLDTTPSLSTNRVKDLKYESKFNIHVTGKNNENLSNNELTLTPGSCFNCNENHNLKDCPLPRDNAKINLARSKFRNVLKNGRYHLEDDQKFSHLKPGLLSDNLRKALGLYKDQLPGYIYRMRKLGYPPGWLEEAQTVRSDLSMYDFEGKNVKTNKIKPFVDPEKIVDYPGFNVPCRGLRDEHRNFGVPPYSEKFSKEVMLEHIKKLEERQQDNLNMEDMDLESNVSDKEASPLKLSEIKKSDKEIDCVSLTELESKKTQLLAELTHDNSESPVFVVMDEVGCDGDENNEKLLEEKKSDITLSSESSPTLPVIKTVAFGTPILKSASPYSRLPKQENFSKNVCDVINFENLPNSTGKYEQMTEVLQKVRKTLKNLHDKNS